MSTLSSLFRRGAQALRKLPRPAVGAAVGIPPAVVGGSFVRDVGQVSLPVGTRRPVSVVDIQRAAAGMGFRAGGWR